MRNFFKRSLPHVSHVKSHPRLQFLGKLLHEPSLWHCNRRSLAGGTAVGLFIAFIPFPMQMLLAATAAILFKVNLPLSVSLVWVTNPFTIPPVFYFNYKLGTMLLTIPIKPIEFELSYEWVLHSLGSIWQPLLLGCGIVASLSALIGYLFISILWRLQIIRLWKNRQMRIKEKLSSNKKQRLRT
ncbi:MAG: DUF2062 domain-containing protein [Thiomargarita sp.]|nr:DUF2062 domain-containing protein [Thiomargarita sp.]